MSDPCFLVASLFAPGSVTTPPTTLVPKCLTAPKLSSVFVPSENRAWQSAIAQNSIPSFDSLVPEFSQRRNSPSSRIQLVSNTQAFGTKQQILPYPISGAQLYQQRLAALKSGKIHTRLSGNSFYPAWQKAVQQPSYSQWKQLLAQEAKAVAVGQGKNSLGIIVGDSISLWFPSEFLPTGKLWLNQGISGENTTQISQRLLTFYSVNANTIYVMAGINDLRQGVPNSVILNNIRSILKQLKKAHPDAEIIIQSILPTATPEISNNRIRYLNENIRFIAGQEGANYLNLHYLFANENGEMRENLTTDGIHLTRQGYEVWREAIHQAEYWIAMNRKRDNGFAYHHVN